MTIYLISVVITEKIPCLLIALIKNHFSNAANWQVYWLKLSEVTYQTPQVVETKCFIHTECSGLHLTPRSYQSPDNYSSAKNWHTKHKSKTNSKKYLQQILDRVCSLTEWPFLSVILQHHMKEIVATILKIF